MTESTVGLGVGTLPPAAPGPGVSDGAQPIGLSPVEMGAWRGFLNAHAHVIRRLEAELEAEQSMPLANYDVLVQLAEAPEYALRMSELASSVLLSRSGLTRLVDRLEREGLVTRRACPDDARGTLAVLTPAGLARLREAWVTHLRGVREHMVSRFNQEELATLGDLLSRLG
jgi:DNA-binding MarR family transcriptional regulator